MPSFSSRSTVFGPIPGTTPGGPAPKRASASSRETTTIPFGLPSSLVILASSRDSEMPTEQVSSVRSRISALIRRIVAFGEKIPVRSRYASSSPTTSTTSTFSRSTSITTAEVSL